MNSVHGRDLDLNRLRAFVVTAEAGSVTAAASRLHLTQSAVSAALERLTEVVGAPLFARQGRGITLTAPRVPLLPSAARFTYPPPMPKSPSVTSTSFSLDDLRALLGAPDPASVKAIVDEETREEFIALGVQIASRHILSDAPRIYGIACEFLGSASEALLDSIDVSLELVSVGVHLAIELRTLTNKVRKTDDAGEAERSAAERAAATAFTSALGLRTRTVRLLKGIAGRSSDLRKRVDDRTGTAETAEALAQGLEAQATLMRELLTHKKDAIATRAKLYRMTEARAVKLDKAALAVRETAAAADARSVAKVRQLEIDFLDGVNLHVLGEVIHAFEGAHDMNASIPRLVPIATRRLLAKHGGRKSAAGVETAGTEVAAAKTEK